MVATIRRLEAVLWEGISGHGSLFGSFRVLFLVCWFGQISFCSIEVLGFHMVSLVWCYSRGLYYLFSIFSFCQLVGALFLYMVCVTTGPNLSSYWYGYGNLAGEFQFLDPKWYF